MITLAQLRDRVAQMDMQNADKVRVTEMSDGQVRFSDGQLLDLVE